MPLLMGMMLGWLGVAVDDDDGISLWGLGLYTLALVGAGLIGLWMLIRSGIIPLIFTAIGDWIRLVVGPVVALVGKALAVVGL